MLRILSLVFAIVLLIGGIILVTGYVASPAYSNTITIEVDYPKSSTWQRLLEIENAPRLKSGVVSVNILEQYGKLTAWQENLRTGGYRIYRMNERIEEEKLVIEMTDSSYGMTGIWTFELRTVGALTQVTITEKSTSTDIKHRGYRTIMGRNHDLLVWIKYIRVGLIQSLLQTP